LVWAHSNSQAGSDIADTHQDLIGETTLKFSSEPTPNVDLVFLCLGHGDAKGYLNTFPWLMTKKIIDLSQDFRLEDRFPPGFTHNPFVYGLVDAYPARIRKAQYVANPGCFATAIQLSLLPAMSVTVLDAIHCNATTGSTGAGQGLSATSHYSWRAGNHSVYKPFAHQHEAEILQTINQLSPDSKPKLRFIPNRGAFTRGIFCTTYFETSKTLAYWKQAYLAFYAKSPFVQVSDRTIDLKMVTNTNKCLLQLEVVDGTLLVVAVIDNLLKGASGQAVENMNIMFDLPQTLGLNLKANYF
jgi:N-acetyl-gamma-glutamyl-phosphate reductase